MIMCRYDEAAHSIVLHNYGKDYWLEPIVVRRNDTSATSIDEWTGERLNRHEGVSMSIKPAAIQRVGNYAVSILWEDGFNQVSCRGSRIAVCM
jgi:hypothetical protein